jgi:putative pyruvate formate lyase activating enzyme
MMKPLEGYSAILSGKRKPRFMTTDLDDKIKQAERILNSCEFCERDCRVNRLEGKKGFCGVGKEWRIFGAHTHFGEEDVLIPSATLFCAGCTMRCVYCQNAPRSITPELGDVWSDKEVAGWVDRKYQEGCRNVNFVSPDCYLWNILKALKLVKAEMPVVWNSNAYYSQNAAGLLKGVVDVYLLDFRYFSGKCAKRLSSAPNYPEVAKRNHLTASRDAEVIIRVLVMPNHIECDAKPILKWIRDKLGSGVLVNILAQYRPCHNAHEYPDINRPLSLSEHEEVVEYARKIGLKNLV